MKKSSAYSICILMKTSVLDNAGKSKDSEVKIEVTYPICSFIKAFPTAGPKPNC
jgi:hypothetical protein